MNTGFKSQCLPTLRLLSTDQIKEIHSRSLEILDTIGVSVSDSECLNMLKDAGCRSKKGHVVKIPPHLVEDCIRSAPSRVTVYNRRGSPAMQLEGDRIHFGMGTDLIYTIDLGTGEIRHSTSNDVINAGRIADQLQNIDFAASYALPHDIATNCAYVASFKALVQNTVKPIFFTAAGSQDLSIIINMAEVVAGSADSLSEKPFIIHYSEPTSPLSHSSSAIKKLFLCADKRIPITYTPGMIPGATGPVTLAGAVALANSEALSGLVIHQLRSRGAPIISGFGIQPMDMSTSIAPYASPEKRLTKSACADIYHYYGLPMWGTAGCSDSFSVDAQASMEAMSSILLSALNGSNLIHDIGYLGQGLLGSPVALVMCNEMISYVKRIMKGFEISDSRFCVDVIARVGSAGNYLMEEHTLEHFKEELWRPKNINRDNLDTWIKKGRKSYKEMAYQEAVDLLKGPFLETLEPQACRSLEDLFKKAEADLAEVHFEV